MPSYEWRFNVLNIAVTSDGGSVPIRASFLIRFLIFELLPIEIVPQLEGQLENENVPQAVAELAKLLFSTYCIDCKYNQLVRRKRVEEAAVDEVDGGVGGVDFVGGVPTVVAEFVEHYFVGGKIGETVFTVLHKGVDGEQQGRLAELVAVGGVGEMADWADGEDDALFFQRTVEERCPQLNNVVDIQTETFELAGRQLQAVAHYAVQGIVRATGEAGVPEHKGSAEGDNQSTALT